MLILNEPKVGAAGGALGTACLPGGKEPSWASPPTSSVLFCRLSRGGPLPPRPAHHENRIQADPLTRALAETRTYAGGKHPRLPCCGPARGSVQRAGSLPQFRLTPRPAHHEVGIPLAACDADFGAQDDRGAFGRRSYPIRSQARNP